MDDDYDDAPPLDPEQQELLKNHYGEAGIPPEVDEAEALFNELEIDEDEDEVDPLFDEEEEDLPPVVDEDDDEDISDSEDDEF